MKWLIKFVVLISLLLVTTEASADCTVSVTPIIFGNYDTLNLAPLDTTGTITVACDTVPPADVTISISTSSSSGIFNPRQMKHTSRPDLLNYNVYTKQNGTTVWGDGTGGTSTVMIKGTKNRKLTAYGSIPPRQNVPAGTYSDILTVTIIF